MGGDQETGAFLERVSDPGILNPSWSLATRSLPVVGTLHEIRSDGIPMDIVQQIKKLLSATHLNIMETVLPDTSLPSYVLSCSTGDETHDVVHPILEAHGSRQTDQRMPVIEHDNIRSDTDPTTLNRELQAVHNKLAGRVLPDRVAVGPGSHQQFRLAASIRGSRLSSVTFFL